MHKRQNQMPSDERALLLTIPEVAKLLGIGRTTVYTLIHQEGLPSVTLGSHGKMRIRRVSLERWLQSRENGS